MLLYFTIALLLGVIIGTITGVTPGIHINLVSAILLALSGSLIGIPPIILVVFLVSIAITHTFVDFIPSIFLGAPDEDNFLSILPGHEMLIKGKAHEAVILTLYGSISALLLIIFFTPLFIFFLPTIYNYAERIMPFILILLSIFLIVFEKSNKLIALIFFILSGFLGLATLSLPLKESLLSLFTGLFGISSLITSIAKKQTLPKQEKIKLLEVQPGKKAYFKAMFASLIGSPLCSFLPGLGSGQAAVIGSEVVGNIERKDFLILLGSINTLVTGLSFVTLYTIGKARTGIAATVGTMLNLNLDFLIIITLAIILSGILSFFITLLVSKYFSIIISKVNYSKLSIVIVLLLSLLVLALSGILGLLLMLVSTFLGLACIYAGVRRTHLMGSLLLPSIVLFLG